MPPHSNVRLHADTCGVEVELDHFNILDSVTSPMDIKILESLYIHKLKPSLNDSVSSVPLLIVNK